MSKKEKPKKAVKTKSKTKKTPRKTLILPHQLEKLSKDARCEICGISVALDRAHILPKRFITDIDFNSVHTKDVKDRLLSYKGKNILILCKNHHYLFDNFKLTNEEFSKIAKKVGNMFLWCGEISSKLSTNNKKKEDKDGFSTKRKIPAMMFCTID